MAALTALQGLRDVGGLRAGQRVIVNGAAGGGGLVRGSARQSPGCVVGNGGLRAASSELVRSLGADEVIDYGREDFTRLGRRYDLLIDTVGNHSLRSFCRALEPSGTLVLAGAGGGRLLGPMAQIFGAKLQSRFLGPRILTMFMQPKTEDLLFIKHLVEEGKLRPGHGPELPDRPSGRRASTPRDASCPRQGGRGDDRGRAAQLSRDQFEAATGGDQ